MWDINQLTIDPWAFLQRNGWYLVAAAVVAYAAAKRADDWAANRHTARAIAEATDPTRVAGLDAKRQAVIARQQAALTEAAKNAPPRPPPAKKPKPKPPAFSGGQTGVMGNFGGGGGYQPQRRRRPGGGG
mmetsp:Transcript_15523/g.46361  ORF Transcript_15523/g.46361 Transcript_15523/m.46361 type:complete len:130 (-) Transcript_15523:79-468(-)